MRHAPLHRFALICALLLPLLADAQSLSGSTESELQQTMERIKQAERDRERIEREREKIEKELEPLQKEMVGLADKLQENEKSLSKLEGDLRILEDSRKTHTDQLQKKRRQLSAALMVMMRMGQTPIEAVFAMPGEADRTLRAAGLLEHSTRRLQKQSAELKAALAELDALDAQIREKYTHIASETSALDKSRSSLSEKLEERGKLQDKLESDQAEVQAELASLAQKSSSLRDLIDAIMDSEALEREARKPRRESPASVSTAPEFRENDGGLRSISKARGKLKLPAAGSVVSGYGENNSAETGKGLVLQTRANAQVRAPFDGEVMFTGPFRNYGNMVIFRHAGGYYTLLSGLERIDCVPGQILLEGEPVGAMGAADSGSRLYIEFREGSKPIDPAPWIAGLSEASSG